ncbi:MAG TPA: glutamine--fructose-6-phosphate aminotransferase, partial [Phycisphaerae bacterium]|nr:glutamine--fructose-6-phosphate aminotransferase [Phycisphaerae bacterium]
MCGIIGYVGEKDALGVLVEGLKRLEYRGYDSAGVALMTNGKLAVHKSAGRISALEQTLEDEGVARLTAHAGIAHTRWATHGAPNDVNAHPHASADGTIAVVHNGIIENFRALRTFLEQKGVVFTSDTD